MMSLGNKVSYIIYTDGGSRGNPGNAAYGFVVYNSEKNVVFEKGERIGIATNNIAEYMGVLSSLEWIRDNTNVKLVESIKVFMDSQLVAMQLSGIYKIKNIKLKTIYNQIQSIETIFSCPITYTHIPRSENKEADKMVNQALDRK